AHLEQAKDDNPSAAPFDVAAKLLLNFFRGDLFKPRVHRRIERRSLCFVASAPHQVAIRILTGVAKIATTIILILCFGFRASDFGFPAGRTLFMADTILIDLKALMVEREDCDAGTVEKLKNGLAQGRTQYRALREAAEQLRKKAEGASGAQ